MIQDNLSVYKNKEVKKMWGENHVRVKDLPPQSGRFSNPLDRNIFAVTKKHIIHEDTSTPATKEASVMKVVENLPGEMIRKCFANCCY